MMVEEGEDRISALPDELFCHILSLLPTIYAVRTTVLSTRWKGKWTSVQNLEFNDEHFNYCHKRFLSFVNRVLLFRDSSSEICKFSVSVTGDLYHIMGKLTAWSLGNWVRTAVRSNPVELEVCGFNEFLPFEMPESLLMCKTIRVLNLSKLNSRLSFEPPVSGCCFPSLKSLHVAFTRIKEDECNKLICSCPVLEELIIHGVLLGSVIDRSHHVKVFAPELKTLITRCNGFASHPMFNLDIDAPKLENLNIEKPLLPILSLMNAKPSLATITLPDLGLFKVRVAAWTQHGFALGHIPSIDDLAIGLLAKISEVKRVSLTAYVLEARHLPAFVNLTGLKLVLLDCNYWELLAEFLHKAPKLEDIVLEDGTKDDTEYSELQWNPPEAVPTCLSSHLKTISIHGFKGRRAEMEVLKYLLKNGYLLKKLTIAYSIYLSDDQKEELRDEFYGFQRAVTCELKL